MRIAAGVITRPQAVFALSEVELVHFEIVPDRLGPTRLIDSGFASPGRYAGEIGRRLLGFYPNAQSVLALNPHYQLSAAQVLAVLLAAERAELGAPCALLYNAAAAGGEQPLAYWFRAEALRACPAAHLALLTAFSRRADADFLAATFGGCEELAVGPLDGAVQPGNGFATVVHPAYAQMCELATAALRSLATPALPRLAEIPRVAVLAFHAGDLLFLVQAIALEQAAIDAVVVPRAYADIIRVAAPQLAVIEVDHPIPGRGSYQPLDEAETLRSFVAQAGDEGLSLRRYFHLLRPIFRPYHQTRAHLREGLAFALGGPGHQPPRRPPELGLVLPKLASPGPKQRTQVIVQLDGGWPIKGYPKERRGELLDLLASYGFAPLLLGAAEPDAPGVPAVPYTDLAAYQQLLAESAAVIGCDSFPAHFAAACGVPTLTLFGPTPPHLARGPETRRYRALHHPMPCVPCHRHADCAIDQGGSCHAHANPSEVVDALRALVPDPAKASGEP